MLSLRWEDQAKALLGKETGECRGKKEGEGSCVPFSKIGSMFRNAAIVGKSAPLKNRM